MVHLALSFIQSSREVLETFSLSSSPTVNVIFFTQVCARFIKVRGLKKPVLIQCMVLTVYSATCRDFQNKKNSEII